MVRKLGANRGRQIRGTIRDNILVYGTCNAICDLQKSVVPCCCFHALASVLLSSDFHIVWRNLKTMKRKYNNHDEDEDEERDEDYGMTQRPALPVSSFDEYDESLPPESGADYLRRVQLELMNEPEIKVADKLRLPNTTSASTAFDGMDDETFIKAPADQQIPKEAIAELLENFRHLRHHIEQIQQRYPDRILCKLTNSKLKRYCYRVSDDVSRPAKEKVLCLVARLGCANLIRLLRCQQEWIHDHGYHDANALWIYAILAAIDVIQPGDVFSTLRQLSRTCSQIRHRMQNHRPDLLPSLNLIVLIIGHFFGQKDLLDES